jgi:two-component system sensor histidine kinase KdpD
MARTLAGVRTFDEIERTVNGFVADVADAKAVMLLCDERGKLESTAAGEYGPAIDFTMAQLACDSPGFTDIDAQHPVRYQSMKTPTRVQGVLAIVAQEERTASLAEHGELLEAVASLAAISIERVRYAEAATAKDTRQPIDKLQRAYLSLVAHELRHAANGIEGLRKVLQDAKTDGISPETWPRLAADLGGIDIQIAETLRKIQDTEHRVKRT